MFEPLGRSVSEFLLQYGYLALFAFMFLETSMLFPFVPSEVVVPVGAGLLVHDPPSFALFVGSVAAGATVGGLFLYYLSDTAGEELLLRYGRYVHVTPREFERGQRWFRRWGQGLVFWGRLLPVLRSIISIPAGLAGMGYPRFAVYTAAGSGTFAALVAGLVTAGVAVTDAGSFRGLLEEFWRVAAARPLVAVAVLTALIVGYVLIELLE